MAGGDKSTVSDMKVDNPLHRPRTNVSIFLDDVKSKTLENPNRSGFKNLTRNNK
jgi:hypothetical protein